MTILDTLSPTALAFEPSAAPKKRAVSEGQTLGRPPIVPELEKRIHAALKAPGRTEGVRKIAARFGVAVGTVQRISRPFEGYVESVSAGGNRRCYN